MTYDRIQQDTCTRLRSFDAVATEAEIRRRLQQVENNVLDHCEAAGLGAGITGPIPTPGQYGPLETDYECRRRRLAST